MLDPGKEALTICGRRWAQEPERKVLIEVRSAGKFGAAEAKDIAESSQILIFPNRDGTLCLLLSDFRGQGPAVCCSRKPGQAGGAKSERRPMAKQRSADESLLFSPPQEEGPDMSGTVKGYFSDCARGQSHPLHREGLFVCRGIYVGDLPFGAAFGHGEPEASHLEDLHFSLALRLLVLKLRPGLDQAAWMDSEMERELNPGCTGAREGQLQGRGTVIHEIPIARQPESVGPAGNGELKNLALKVQSQGL